MCRPISALALFTQLPQPEASRHAETLEYKGRNRRNLQARRGTVLGMYVAIHRYPRPLLLYIHEDTALVLVDPTRYFQCSTVSTRRMQQSQAP